MDPSSSAPSTSRRLVAVSVWLGLLLLASSVLIAALAVSSRAEGTSSGGSGDSGDSRLASRAVAIAYVDVEGGVVPLYPTQPGRVTAVLRAEGEPVSAGDKLFQIDDFLAQNHLSQAKLDLEAAEQRLEQAKLLDGQHRKRVAAQKAAIEVARQDVEAASAQHAKAQRYYKDRLGGSAEDVRAAAAVRAKARAGVRAEEAKLALIESTDPSTAVKLAEIDVKAKKEQIAKAEYGVAQCTVTAPVKGTVLRRQVSVGEVLGSNPRQPALIFCPDKPRIVRAEVEQEFATRISVGQNASLQDDVTHSGSWKGKVKHVSDWFTQRRSVLLEPLQYNDVRTLEVILSVEQDAKNPLRIGQRVRVTLDGSR